MIRTKQRRVETIKNREAAEQAILAHARQQREFGELRGRLLRAGFRAELDGESLAVSRMRSPRLPWLICFLGLLGGTLLLLSEVPDHAGWKMLALGAAGAFLGLLQRGTRIDVSLLPGDPAIEGMMFWSETVVPRERRREILLREVRAHPDVRVETVPSLLSRMVRRGA